MRIRDYFNKKGLFSKGHMVNPPSSIDKELMRIRQVRDLTCTMLRAHREGRFANRRELSSLNLPYHLCFFMSSSRILPESIALRFERMVLSVMIRNIIRSDATRRLFVGEVASYISGSAPPPRVQIWSAELSRVYEQLYHKIQITSLGTLCSTPNVRTMPMHTSISQVLAIAAVISLIVIGTHLVTQVFRPKHGSMEAPAVDSRELLSDEPANRRIDTGLSKPVEDFPVSRSSGKTTTAHINEQHKSTSVINSVGTASEASSTQMVNSDTIDRKTLVDASLSTEVQSPEEATSPLNGILQPTKGPEPELNASWILSSTSKEARIKLSRGHRQTEIILIEIPSGSYDMGSERRDESPVRTIKVSPFYMAKFEITKAQFSIVLGDTTAFHQDKAAALPASDIDWATANTFCLLLQQALGKQVLEVRLPFEYEWEYVAKSGGGSSPNELARYAWVGENIDVAKLHAVGGKQANKFGIYDLFGNVSEWMLNAFHPYLTLNPQGPIEGQRRVHRGGSCFTPIADVYTSKRFVVNSDFADLFIGFRIVAVQ